MNRTASQQWNKTPNDLVGTSFYDVLPPEAAHERKTIIESVVQSAWPVEYREECSGRIIDHKLAPIVGSDGSVRAVACFARDATQSAEAEQRLNLANAIIQQSTEAIVLTDRHAQIVNVNEAFCQITGYAREELIGKNPRLLKSQRHDRRFYEKMWSTLLSEGAWQGEIWDRRKDGEVYPKLLTINAVRNEANEITHFVGFSSDLTSIKQTEGRLEELAHYDPLTGLANRVLFRDRLSRAIQEAKRTNGMVGLLLLDLDGFKNINDTWGHPIGDKLLIALAGRLNACVRDSETVGRLGGDEFVIVLPDVTSSRHVGNVAGRILEEVSTPFDLDGRRTVISGSIGISLAPNDGEGVDKLLQHADIALYRSKESGKNRLQFFSKEMNDELAESTELSQEFRLALEQDHLELHYQPQVDFRTGIITGVEALLRWRHPSRGYIAPERLVPLAEESGFIVNLGDWVLRTACRQNATWQKMGLPGIRVAVNVSGYQLMQRDFVEKVLATLDETGLAPNLLELELTESVALLDINATVRAFGELRSHGITVCIDDFGTGYSSLSYLKILPIHKVKIDKSFVGEIASYHDNEPIVKAIIAVAHSLGLTVIAEGIETSHQVGRLWSLGCDGWQGYYFSVPKPAEDCARMMREDLRGLSFNFHWGPDWTVNVEEIDGQHREWFERMDAFCKSVLQGDPGPQLKELLHDMDEYALYHFQSEEALMLDIGYPGYHVQQAAHQSLIKDVGDLKKQMDLPDTSTDLLMEAVTRFYRSSVDHIQTLDRALGNYVSSPRQG